MPTGTKIDPFKPKQPQIPGVPESAPPERTPAPPREARQQPATDWGAPPVSPPSALPPELLILMATAVVVVIVGLAWRARISSAKPSAPPAAPAVSAASAAPVSVRPAQTLPIGPGQIATEGELAKPWSSRRFLFRNQLTSELIPGLAVRLPGGALWGISLREPYGTCQLDYVSDLGVLRSVYGLRSSHPLVVDPCSGAAFDLSQYTSAPNGLVRGQLIRGNAIRPPFAIELAERGRSIVAVRLE